MTNDTHTSRIPVGCATCREAARNHQLTEACPVCGALAKIVNRATRREVAAEARAPRSLTFPEAPPGVSTQAPSWARFVVVIVSPIGANAQPVHQAFAHLHAAEAWAWACARALPAGPASVVGFVLVYAMAPRATGSRFPLRTFRCDDAFAYLALDPGGRVAKDQTLQLDRTRWGLPQEGWNHGRRDLWLLRVLRVQAEQGDGAFCSSHTAADRDTRVERDAVDRLVAAGLVTIVRASVDRTTRPAVTSRWIRATDEGLRRADLIDAGF